MSRINKKECFICKNKEPAENGGRWRSLTAQLVEAAAGTEYDTLPLGSRLCDRAGCAYKSLYARHRSTLTKTTCSGDYRTPLQHLPTDVNSTINQQQRFCTSPAQVQCTVSRLAASNRMERCTETGLDGGRRTITRTLVTDEEAKLATTIFHDELAEGRCIPVGIHSSISPRWKRYRTMS